MQFSGISHADLIQISWKSQEKSHVNPILNPYKSHRNIIQISLKCYSIFMQISYKCQVILMQIFCNSHDNVMKQAGTELGQAQLKLELYYTLIFHRFGLIELTGWYINYFDCIN